MFERSGRRPVVAALDVDLAEADEAVREFRVEFGNLLKLGDGNIELPFFLGCDSRLHVLGALWRRNLPCEQENQECADHGFSGSRTSRNWSAGTSLNT